MVCGTPRTRFIKRINEDGSETDEVYESFGDFGTAHYKSLGENNKKKLTHDSNGGWDKVKVLDSVKRKFFSANTLLPMGEKPRSQSRAKSASRKSNAAAAAGGGGGEELNIAKPKNSRRKPQASPQPSPKEVAQAAAVLVVAATQDEDDKKFFYYKDDDGCLSKITSSVEFYNTFCDSFSYERKELIKTNSSDIFERVGLGAALHLHERTARRALQRDGDPLHGRLSLYTYVLMSSLQLALT